MTDLGPIEAVLAHPDEDWPRLVFADWCDEQGQCERGEFIRVQCRLAELGECRQDFSLGLSCCCPYCNAGGFTLRRREQELLDEWWAKWTHQAFDNLAPDVGVATGDPSWDVHIYLYSAKPRQEEIGDFHCTYRRGFVAVVTCTAADWLAHGDAITACQPVEKVRFSVMPTDDELIAMDAAVRAYRDGRPSVWTMRRWPRVKTWVLPPQPSFTSNDVYQMIAEIADNYERSGSPPQS